MVSLDDGKYVDSYDTSQLEREWRRRLNRSTIAILFNDCRLGGVAFDYGSHKIISVQGHRRAPVLRPETQKSPETARFPD